MTCIKREGGRQSLGWRTHWCNTVVPCARQEGGDVKGVLRAIRVQLRVIAGRVPSYPRGCVGAGARGGDLPVARPLNRRARPQQQRHSAHARMLRGDMQGTLPASIRRVEDGCDGGTHPLYVARQGCLRGGRCNETGRWRPQAVCSRGRQCARYKEGRRRRRRQHWQRGGGRRLVGGEGGRQGASQLELAQDTELDNLDQCRQRVVCPCPSMIDAQRLQR